jgi:hypothetical protein
MTDLDFLRISGQNCHRAFETSAPRHCPNLSKVPSVLTVQCVLISACVLKRLRRIKEKGLRGSKSPGIRRGLMILKIFFGMEWMLILGGELGLYIYLVTLVSFRLFGLEKV